MKSEQENDPSLGKYYSIIERINSFRRINSKKSRFPVNQKYQPEKTFPIGFPEESTSVKLHLNERLNPYRETNEKYSISDYTGKEDVYSQYINILNKNVNKVSGKKCGNYVDVMVY